MKTKKCGEKNAIPLTCKQHKARTYVPLELHLLALSLIFKLDKILLVLI